MECYYINNINQRIDFMKWPYRISTEDIRNYSWSYNTLQTQTGFKITRMYRNIITKRIGLHVRDGYIGETYYTFREAMDNLYDVCDYDVITGKMGKLYVNGTYMKCFITASTKTNQWMVQGSSNAEIEITASEPVWIDEKNAIYEEESQEETEITHVYPFGYPYGYPIHYFRRTVKNTSFVPADFRMRIYGPCVNPSISIAGHVYKVLSTAVEGEYFEIDSDSKTVYLHSGSSQTNMFNARYKDSNIFEKIPVGESVLSADGAYTVEVTVYGKRGEPKWTISS